MAQRFASIYCAFKFYRMTSYGNLLPRTRPQVRAGMPKPLTTAGRATNAVSTRCTFG